MGTIQLHGLKESRDAGYSAGWNYAEDVTSNGPRPLPVCPFLSEALQDAWQRGFDAGEQASVDAYEGGAR